ncbi:hypothetical protein HK098_004632, partial [Nowakowskiella sp. JEL0407]
PYKSVRDLLTKAKESDSPNWRAIRKHFNSLIKANTLETEYEAIVGTPKTVPMANPNLDPFAGCAL